MTCDPAEFTVLTMPARFAAIGDPHAAMDAAVGSLDGLLELAVRDESEGLGDAPWPPHFAKGESEGPRVAPSRAKKAFSEQIGEGLGEKRFRGRAKVTDEASGDPPAKPKRTGRVSKDPLIVVAQSQDKAAAEAGLERWKAAHPEAAALLAIDDVMVDRMRGSAYVWYRIRVNLRHVPEAARPGQGVPDPDDDPTREWRAGGP